MINSLKLHAQNIDNLEKFINENSNDLYKLIKNTSRIELIELKIDFQKIILFNKNILKKINTNIDEIYKETLKSLYSEIIRFSSLSQKHMTHEERTTVGSLKTASRKIVKSVKEIKELQKNINHFSQGKNSDIKYEYNLLREQLAYTLREIETLRKDEINEIDRLTKMETIKIKIDEFDAATNEKIDDLIRTNKIDARMATSLINDASFASHICVRLVEIANIMWIDDKEFQKIGEDNEY